MFRSSTPHSQLHLFDDEQYEHAPRRGRSAARRSRFRTGTRTLLTVLAIGIATAGIMAGSFAAWTAQTTNPANSVTAGTLALTNSKNGIAVFSASNIVPGDTGSDTVTLTNAGTVPLAASLTQDNVTSTGIEASLRLRVYDQTRNWCYWPVNQTGACPGTGGPDNDGYGAWNATGTLNTLALPSTAGAARWPAGEAHTFTISWKLAASSPNSDQGKTGSFHLVWNGTQ